MKKYKISINAPLDYIMGYLRYGHFEGEVELTEEEFQKFKEEPISAIEELNLEDCLHLKIDGWSIEDWGHIVEVDYNVINEED